MKKGFTLAEVLITLGIIGVVAALTIPSMVAKHQERERIVKLKKAYGTIQTAFNTAQFERGDLNTWADGTTGTTGSDNQAVYDNLSPYLKIGKNCGIANNRDCFPDRVKWLSDSSKETLMRTNLYKFVLNDGTAIAWHFPHAGVSMPGHLGGGPVDTITKCTENITCGYIYVDVNGMKGPNTYGKDVFQFIIFSGTKAVQHRGTTIWTPFEDTCLANQGTGCAGWVLIHGNMDYLHCPDKISWNGPYSCK